jgi:hypothetical protein
LRRGQSGGEHSGNEERQHQPAGAEEPSD